MMATATTPPPPPPPKTRPFSSSGSGNSGGSSGGIRLLLLLLAVLVSTMPLRVEGVCGLSGTYADVNGVCVLCPENSARYAPIDVYCVPCQPTSVAWPGSDSCTTYNAGAYMAGPALRGCVAVSAPNIKTYTLGVCNGNAGTGGAGPTACDYTSLPPNDGTQSVALASTLTSAYYYFSTIPQGIQIWSVGANAWYQLIAGGAAGGSFNGMVGGRGIVIMIQVKLYIGQQVAISVGQGPSSVLSFSGGGASTFSIYDGTGPFNDPAQHTPLLVAGGGGGAGCGSNGMDATAQPQGTLCNGCPASLQRSSNGGGGGIAGGANGNYGLGAGGGGSTPMGCPRLEPSRVDQPS